MSKTPRPSSPADASTGAAPSFEKALAELEKIVTRMEAGNLSLEESLAAHKRGLELAKLCQARLEAAQQQVQVLEGEILKPLSAAVDDSADD